LSLALVVAVLGLAFPFLLIFVFSRASGWPALADRYPAPPQRPRPLVRLGYGVFAGWIGYNGGIVLSADAGGLYLAAMPVILSWCHAPIYIPWAEVREIRVAKRLWSNVYEVETRGAPEVDMALRSGTFAPARSFALAAGVMGAY
jgi:hypothetical protein